MDKGLSNRVQNVRFVLDELQQLDKNSPLQLLTGRLDLERVGLFGHSFGGGTTLLACALDKRFRCGLSMDGVVPSQLTAASITPPFFFMEARRASDDPLGTRSLYSKLSSPWWSIKIDGATHVNFTDLPLLTPMHRTEI